MKEKCRNHPTVYAINFCYSCGHYFCADCLNVGREYYFCKDEKCKETQGHELNTYYTCSKCGFEGKIPARIIALILTKKIEDNTSFKCDSCRVELLIDISKSLTGTLKTVPIINPKKSFFKYLHDVFSGRIAKGNRLFGDHYVKVSEKADKNNISFFRVIVKSTAYCAVNLLNELLFEIKQFDFEDENHQPNPFMENLNKLDDKNSFEMFKLIAECFFIQFLLRNFHLDFRYEDVQRIDEDELINWFFEVYEYNNEDKKTLHNLIELSNNKSDFYLEYQLYDNILEKIYHLRQPKQILQKIFFSSLFNNIHNAMFPYAFTEWLHGEKSKG